MTTKVSTIMQTPGTASEVHLHTTNGFGSTNTKIRRWTTAITNTGSDITYADSSTLGATFTINTTGLYSIDYTDQFNAADILGISLNSSQLTTSIISITAADAIIYTSSSDANEVTDVGITLTLVATDVIRCHAGGAVTGAVPARARFHMTRIG